MSALISGHATFVISDCPADEFSRRYTWQNVKIYTTALVPGRDRNPTPRLSRAAVTLGKGFRLHNHIGLMPVMQRAWDGICAAFIARPRFRLQAKAKRFETSM